MVTKVLVSDLELSVRDYPSEADMDALLFHFRILLYREPHNQHNVGDALVLLN